MILLLLPHLHLLLASSPNLPPIIAYIVIHHDTTTTTTTIVFADNCSSHVVLSHDAEKHTSLGRPCQTPKDATASASHITIIIIPYNSNNNNNNRAIISTFLDYNNYYIKNCHPLVGILLLFHQQY